MPFTHQVCQAHGLHLAVVDVIFKKFEINDSEDVTTQNEKDLSDDDDDDDNDNDTEDFENNDQVEAEDRYSFQNFENLQVRDVKIGSTLKKVRGCVTLFRRSPALMDALQKKCGELNIKFKRPILSIVTRWGSTLNMIEVFIEMQNAIVTVLSSVRSSIVFTEQDFELIKILCKILSPIRRAQEMMSTNDSNMLTAEGCLRFVMKKLESVDHCIGRTMLESVKKRIIQRRPKTLVTLLSFLNNPESVDFAKKSDVFSFSTRKEMIKLAKHIMQACFKSEEDSETINDENISNEAESKEELDQDSELELCIQEACALPDQVEPEFKSIDSELKSFEKTRKLTSNRYSSLPNKRTSRISVQGGILTKIK